MTLQAPFPYFGGKAAIAHVVWRALGQPAHYIEPFFGSGAVLLARPRWRPSMCETVCDINGFLCNVWRALQFAPDETARWCDWPVNHADLIARKKALIANETRLLDGLASDEKWNDPVMAGYWIWAASCWIGSGLLRPNQIPHVGNTGMGVHALGQRPHVSRPGMGVHALGKRPHVSNAGMGVHALGQIPHVSNTGMGVQEPYATHLWTWFRALSERLRYVRVVCGDWTRVCGGNWQANSGMCGIFFDPPYSDDANRDDNLYDKHDSLSVAHDVRAWCLERGDDRAYRIVLAGYREEHEELLAHGWHAHAWKAKGGYANLGKGAGRNNRLRETLFLSPYCAAQEIEDLPTVSKEA
jgi:site-specific DNA-adenine methylase